MPGAAADATRPPTPARLKVRADFLRVASGLRVHSRSVSLQATRQRPDESGDPRVGLTVTRKTGSAVERNRIKRRLREALRADLPVASGHDFVLVARRDALATPFASLVGELRRCFADHQAGRARASGPRRKPDPKTRPSAKTDPVRGRAAAARCPRPEPEPA